MYLQTPELFKSRTVGHTRSVVQSLFHGMPQLPLPAVSLCLLLGIISAQSAAVESVLVNPTTAAWSDLAIRMPAPLPTALIPADGSLPRLHVTRDGRDVPVVAVQEDGDWWAVVRDSVPARSRAIWQVAAGAGKPAPAGSDVLIRRGDGVLELDNGRIAVRLPAQGESPGPIVGLRLDGRWIGRSRWVGTPPFKAFRADIIADGTVTAAVRLRWDFQAMAGIAGDVPAFATVTIRLDPGADHVEVQEQHTMPVGSRWEFVVAEGWQPDRVITKPHWMGAGGQESSKPPASERPLGPVDNLAMAPDLVLNLIPRWNQHFKDGWRAAFSDGRNAVTAVAVAAGRWVWPHDNSIEASIVDGGALRAPTWRGRRVWWLLAGPEEGARVPLAYLERWWYRHPSRIGGFQGDPANADLPGLDPFDGNRINPTGQQRQLGKQALAGVGKPPAANTVWRLQEWVSPDIYGSYWLGWSPENPNFFTDFNTQALAWSSQLASAAAPQWAALAKARLQEDLLHAVTLPGGAGQECPGYLRHALETIQRQAQACSALIGYDPTTDPRYLAGRRFLERISQPDGNIRRDLPIGDTHPDRKGGSGPLRIEVAADEVQRWTSEEFPGFGAILRNRPGTPQETYVAFKSGPNRGHYHGDQLAVHWCGDARPLAVDHHCSYAPRAGQEHMHNRVAFSTDGLPYANMDGYERLIGFAAAPLADIAVGEVASPRLRAVAALPPEIWHQEWPRIELAGELVYRRTLILVKGGARDYLVMHDAWRSPRPLTASFMFHVLREQLDAQPRRATWGDALTLVNLQQAEPTAGTLPWSHANGGTESTQGLRWTLAGTEGSFVVVAWPGGDAPPMRRDGDRLLIGTDIIEILPGGGATVRRGPAVAVLPDATIDRDRTQGDIGLFVPDAGYPFGPIPDWLIRQRWPRTEAPAWALRLRNER